MWLSIYLCAVHVDKSNKKPWNFFEFCMVARVKACVETEVLNCLRLNIIWIKWDEILHYDNTLNQIQNITFFYILLVIFIILLLFNLF